MSKIAEWAADEISGKPNVACRCRGYSWAAEGQNHHKRRRKGVKHAAMPPQKDSWRHLVAKEEFGLIGEPLSEEHLISIQEGAYKILKEAGVIDVSFDEWVSGDYVFRSDRRSQLSD